MDHWSLDLLDPDQMDPQMDPRLLPVPFWGGEYQFESRTGARADAAAAIELANPSLFGAALHEIQDSYSHWGEGYRMPLGHLSHTWIAASRVTLQSRGAHQGASLLSQFYQEHPENELRTRLSRVCTSGDIARVSRMAPVDLYLRTCTSPGSAERERFGYNTDLYFSFTPRDIAMRAESRDWLAAFALSLNTCKSDRILTQRHPTVDEVLAFLDAQ